ncbi:hypothetical protein [Bradyrhizobium sp. MOS003]|uniref:hypothetical protein n=1 Tax=Bradyrhizobium sp. MOS003 TaxID=2133946 RepID=UPI000D121E6B|nr:hypothetical protein [Bradyrhizobium sp. MOS003]PSO16494.1 hypothetical protein C7G42_23545 [Bradyrhizobium sp. MOS003]
MRSVRCAVVIACTLWLGACTTEPYKESISTFAKGVSASQSALAKLDERNNEIKRRIQIRAQLKDLRIGSCEIGRGCTFEGLTPPKSTIPNALLYMAQVTAYSNGLAELAAAKDTEAIQKAVGKIDSAARAGVKSFGSQVRQSATVLAALDLVGFVASEVIEAQRVEALRAAIIRNRYRIENAITSLGATSYQLQGIVIGVEKGYLQEQAEALKRSTDPAEQVRLTNELSLQEKSLNELATADSRVPFRALLVAHRAVVRAAKDSTYSFTDAAGLLLDFFEKAQALDAAVKKGA